MYLYYFAKLIYFSSSLWAMALFLHDLFQTLLCWHTSFICQTCDVQIRNNKIEMPSFLCMWFALSEFCAELIPSLLIGIPLLYFFLEHFLYYIDINLTIFFFVFASRHNQGRPKHSKGVPRILFPPFYSGIVPWLIFVYGLL